MSNDPTPGWNPEWGATLDPDTSAKSRLFRCWIEFDEKRKASAVPRKDGDRWMNVRCRIVPQNQPPGWVDHLELKVWDPAYPNAQRHRIINGDSGDPCISKMWDGKLYVDGNESTTPYYTQASDVFMQATIHWNPLSPSKSWENSGDSNTFDEDRYAIVARDLGTPVSSCPTNFAWISASPSMPFLYAQVAWNGEVALPETVSWNFKIRFSRESKYTGSTEDSYSPPAPLSGTQSWIVDFGADIRGGNGTFTCAFTGQTLTHLVPIRGRNPIPDSAAENYINDNCGDHWYAMPIAIQETKCAMSAQDPANPERVHLRGGASGRNYAVDGAVFNQFYPDRYRDKLPDIDPHRKESVEVSPGVFEQLGFPGGPMHRHDGNYAGYGMMQITNPPATNEQVWNWKANVDGGIANLQAKWSASDFSRPHTNIGLPDQIDVMGHLFTYDGGQGGGLTTYHALDTIKRFNGGQYFRYDTQGNQWYVLVTLPPDNSEENTLDYTQRVMRYHPHHYE